MLRRRPRATLNDTPFPYTMLFLSRDQCDYHFGGADAVAGDVDHVINAPGDPVIAVSVAAAAIAGEIHAGVGAEIGIDKELMIAVNRAHLRRPRIAQYQIAFGLASQNGSVCVDKHR